MQKHKTNYNSFEEVEKDISLLDSFQVYMESNDLQVKMKGEPNYLKMKENNLILNKESTYSKKCEKNQCGKRNKLL